jgi:hypothetical protein
LQEILGEGWKFTYFCGILINADKGKLSERIGHKIIGPKPRDSGAR